MVVGNALCQELDAERIYSAAEELKTGRYELDRRYEYLVLQSSFSKEQIQKIPFTDRRILKIDLVNTSFRESVDFDQKKLDVARLTGLIDLNPRITENTFLDWRIVEQTGCKSAETCQEFFHGFVVYYDTYYTKDITKQEIDSIRKDLSQFQNQLVQLKDQLQIAYERIDCEYPELLYSSERITEKISEFYSCYDDYKGRVFFEVDIDHGGRSTDVRVKGNLFPCKENLAGAIRKSAQWQRGIVIGNQQFDITAKGFLSFPLKGASFDIQGFEIRPALVEKYQMLQQYAKCVAYDMDTSYVNVIPKVTKKEVSQVLFRNRVNPDLVIVDVTGSMFPYTADLLKWLKMANHPEERMFVFFNDGNDKETSEKHIGSTGGLYSVKSNDFAVVRDRMFEAMRAGGGGDLPENNFEALLYGYAQERGAREVVMIADNYSFPRDYDLLTKYSGNLKIILCHTEKGINTRYIDLAKQYGFSLHTLKTDVSDFTRRDVIINGRTYRESTDGYHEVR